MWRLHQVDQPFTWERDHVTGDYIQYGEFYYKSDKTGAVISRKTYREAKEAERVKNWDYSRLNNAMSQREYREITRQQRQAMVAESILSEGVEEAF